MYPSSSMGGAGYFQNYGSGGGGAGVLAHNPSNEFAPQYSQPPQTSQTPLARSYGAYNAAVNTQAGDYSDLMSKYRSLYDSMSSNPNQSYTPQQYQYNEGSDLTSALGNLKNLSTTGGYSDDDIANLRARGVSPIRSVYASANRDVDRAKSLQGGFSPNYAASKAKMARDQSAQIANEMDNVNAGIAQNVTANKMQASQAYGQLAGNESSNRNMYGSKNADAQNQASQFNMQFGQQKNQQMADMLSRMTSLYGTTPALSQLFGSQALQGAGLQNEINQGNQRNNLQLISSMLGGMN